MHGLDPDAVQSDSSDVRAALARWRVRDQDAVHKLLHWFAGHEAIAPFADRLFAGLDQALPDNPEPDRAIRNVQRVIEAALAQTAGTALVAEIVDRVGELSLLVGSSQYVADHLARNPEWFAWLGAAGREFVSARQLAEQLNDELRGLRHEGEVLDALRRFRHRHTVRIAYRDLVLQTPLATIAYELSELADAVIQVAFDWTYADLVSRFGQPVTEHGSASRFCVLAMGKHGGQELNYSSDVDLIFLYDGDGQTAGERQLTNQEFWRRLAAALVRMLTAHTAAGYAYRIDLRLRPEGRSGAVVRSLPSMLHYYQTLGRTWERQALIKARPCAGDLRLGQEFLQAIDPLIYRRYLTAEQIAEIKLMKRRIEARSAVEHGLPRDVKLSSGGIRDVEFVVQFLQLLHGAALPELRERNTLKALAALERANCLRMAERQALEDAYIFLRTIEHRLQLFADRQTHELPADEEGLEILARKLGYRGSSQIVVKGFLRDLKQRTEANRHVLRFLLQDAFRGDGPEHAAVESELLLDPDPELSRIEQVLTKYNFRDVRRAYQTLVQLASEPAPFLSSLRCRHLMAALAPRLLAELARRPDPDRTLYQLEAISRSLGARGALWELFRIQPDLMQVVLDIASYSQMLQNLLCSSPGMMDDLVDSFELASLPGREEMAQELSELLEGARDPIPILASFRAAYELRVGVRLLLGRDLPSTAACTLRALYSALLERLALLAFARLARRYGTPSLAKGRRTRPCRWCVLAGELPLWGVGAFFDAASLLVVYEADGVTVHETQRRGWEPTTNQHFFHELACSIAGIGGGPSGLLRLEPGWPEEGRGTRLSTPLDQLDAMVAELPGSARWHVVIGPDVRFRTTVLRNVRSRLRAAAEVLRASTDPAEVLRLACDALGRATVTLEQRQPKYGRLEQPWDLLKQRQLELFDGSPARELARPMEFLVGLRLHSQLYAGAARAVPDEAQFERFVRQRLADFWPEHACGVRDAVELTVTFLMERLRSVYAATG